MVKINLHKGIFVYSTELGLFAGCSKDTIVINVTNNPRQKLTDLQDQVAFENSFV